MTTVAEMLDKYIEEHGPDMAPRTLRDYKQMLPRLKAAFGSKDVDAVEPRDVGLFLNVKKGKISANRHIVILSAAYSLAVGRWWLAKTNPCLKVLRNPTKPRTRYIKDDEFAAFRARLPPMYQIAMDIALYSGQRQGDILAMKWSDVDGYDKVITLTQSKTGHKMGIRIKPKLEAALCRSRAINAQPKDDDDIFSANATWVLPMYVIRCHDNRPFSPEGFRASWQRFMRAWKEEGHEPFHFHDIRAKACSDSNTLAEAAALLGHIDTSVTRRVYDRGVRIVDSLA